MKKYKNNLAVIIKSRTFALAIKEQYNCSNICNKKNGSVAQLNRASDYGSEGCGFESRRNHKEFRLFYLNSFLYLKL